MRVLLLTTSVYMAGSLGSIESADSASLHFTLCHFAGLQFSSLYFSIVFRQIVLPDAEC